jgi:hypothetical protein
MVAFIVKDFGGEIPRREPRLLPDNMATMACNCDLAAGPLDGLPQPEPVIDLSVTASWPVRRAYRVPAPTASDTEVWMALPSEFSSVVPSPLTNDTSHRYYWTNPVGSPDAGAWWNTYAGIRDHTAHYSMGFIAPDPASAPVVTVAGGSSPTFIPGSTTVAEPGTGYQTTFDLTIQGGTPVAGQPQLILRIMQTQARNISIVNRGSGGTNGSVRLIGVSGIGAPFQVQGTIAGGQLVSIDAVVTPGAYAANPVDITNEPVTGGGLTGATVSLQMGVLAFLPVNLTSYTDPPVNPAATLCSGPGVGATIAVSYIPSGAPPLVERVYLYTFVDAFGSESSPSGPSDVVAGPADGTWTITNLPATAPVPPAGKNYPPPVTTRIYRTLTGDTSGAQFFFVADVPFGTTSYVDTIPDTTVVNNNILLSVSWAPPPDGLDGLIAMPGGMLVAFTGNTVHFCEPNRPHAWPAGYDQSLLYPIVGLALWQQSLVVLTNGFPSTGSGTSPSQFIFAQIQTPEPCIARGSIVTDLAGVYYASTNGLIMLNYFGAQNQTLSNLTREIWLKRFNAAHIVACRHRAQYLAINGTGMGFAIDYTEQRMGITQVSPFVDVVSVWNDVYTGDTYMVAAGVVYKWDSTNTPSLTYAWRSREFYFPKPVSLGACQISLDPAVIAPAPPNTAPPPMSGMGGYLDLPNGVNAIFRLFVGPSQTLVHEEWLRQTRCIFRFPSGRKAFDWQFEIVARVPIHSVELASTMRELQTV